MRATFGALLCTFDQFSDIITIHTLFSVGLVGSASALLTMISLAIAVQVERGSTRALQPGPFCWPCAVLAMADSVRGCQ